MFRPIFAATSNNHPMPLEPRFLQKLREHLTFIERSCAAFDQGHEDEALRIAASLRVLFHDARHSVSVFTHLKLKESKMLTSSRGHGDFHDYLVQVINVASPEPVRMRPMLGHRFREVDFAHWWSVESVFVHEAERFSRQKIVLSVANKDGGAHVDAKLEPYYEVLCAGEYALGFTANVKFSGPAPFTQGVTHYAKNAHLALLRQFAHETLVSCRRLRLPTG